jgi:hypothetical protein
LRTSSVSGASLSALRFARRRVAPWLNVSTPFAFWIWLSMMAAIAVVNR